MVADFYIALLREFYYDLPKLLTTAALVLQPNVP
jgi:hypothetical protein